MTEPKISIGMPVYNGEKFLNQRLSSILSQTFTDFEVVISDNASIDSTPKICQDYLKKDSRIRYFRQPENIGMTPNFDFVLSKAQSPYFVWAAVDDLWHSDFLKKNMTILTSDKNLIGSSSKVKPYEKEEETCKPTDKKEERDIPKQKHSTSYQIKHLIEKILWPQTMSKDIHSMSGTFDEKVRFYLKKSSCNLIYGIYRTDILRKSILKEVFLGSDWAINLNLLKYGHIHVIDEYLVYKYIHGASRNELEFARTFDRDAISSIFLWLPFTSWCIKNLGLKIFFKNFDYFFLQNYMGLTIRILAFYSKHKKRRTGN